MNHTKQRYTALRAVRQELDTDKDYELAVKEWMEQNVLTVLEIEGYIWADNCTPVPANN